MRFATVSAAVATFAVSALAQIDGFDAIVSPTDGQKVVAGEKLNIKWQPRDVTGSVKIALIGGATQNTQVPLTTISSGVDNQAGAFEWAVPADLGDKAVYGLTITLESDPKTFQYSFPFHIAPAEGGASTAAATSEAAGGYKASGMPTVTVSLSSAASTAAASSSAPAYEVSSAPAVSSSKAVVPATSSAPAATYPTVAPAGNSSASYSAGVPTTMASYPATNSSKPTGAPSPIPTAGASRLATGSFIAVAAGAAYFFL
ncbi:uncharacterized protein PG986_007646 [Apiospora aurea]|uniref:Yeast cell wall synthesis Kre9/Knh1-like N-terminal domain-containing protein n=1 Tax=Apiospora aurea TaxID=335848 RepID=A0ABR1QDH2_9PEZI